MNKQTRDATVAEACELAVHKLRLDDGSAPGSCIWFIHETIDGNSYAMSIEIKARYLGEREKDGNAWLMLTTP